MSRIATHVLVLLILVSRLASAAQLSIPAVDAAAGNTVLAALYIAAQGSQITGVQVDVQTDPSLGVAASLGTAASTAGKALSTVDLGKGSRRLLVAGLNQTALPDGVLVSLNVSIPAGATAPSYPVHLTNVSATDKNGQSVAISVTDGVITLGSGSALSSAGAFPHIASGGGWKTTFTVLNLDVSPITVKLNLWDDNGNPLALPLTFPQQNGTALASASSAQHALGVGQMYVVETEAASAQTGWADLLSSGKVAGFAVFRYRSPQTNQDTEALVPLENRTSNTFLLPFDNTTGFLTGIAVANPTSLAESVTATWADDLGNPLGTQSISLPAMAHTAFVSASTFAGSAGLRGTVTLSVSSGARVAVLGIRGNPFGSFTSSPAFTN